MNSEQRQIIKSYLNILLRRKNILIFFLIIGLAAGLWQYLRMPKVYKSTALLKYQRQSINPTLMSPDDKRTRTRDVVDSVTQQILSRSSLEALVNEYRLYESMRRNLPMEDVVDRMKNHISTKLLSNGEIFQVSYQGKNQAQVVKVANALAAKFIEENLRLRQEQASQTSTYIKDELEMAKQALDHKEKIMRDYKLQYYNEMPEQLNNNTTRLNSLQNQYQNNQTSSLQLERTRLLVQEQITQRKEILDQNSLALINQANKNSQADELVTINKINQRLQQLSIRYTDKHPEIKRLKKLLEDLQGQQSLASQQSNGPSSSTNPTGYDPQLQQLNQQSKDIRFSLNRLSKERKMLETQIKRYENWITAAPVREAEWTALTRDYAQFNKHYQGLVTKNIQAESAQSLENQLKGSQFKIIDSAHFPEKPFKPDFKKILVMSLAVGLGIGGVIALGLELLRSTFKDPGEIEDFLGVQVICAVPMIPTKRERLIGNVKSLGINSFLLLAASGVIGATIYYWKQGLIII